MVVEIITLIFTILFIAIIIDMFDKKDYHP
jgi:cbb3-type cytochrome oxidase subunit 3